MSRVGLSIIVPMRNEHAIARGTVERLAAFCAERSETIEIIVVDDHSEPAMKPFDELCAPNTRAFSIANEGPRGKGAAVGCGMRAATGALRVFIDADLAYPPSEIAKIVDALATNDIVGACRTLPASRVVATSGIFRSAIRRLLSRTFNVGVQSFLLPGIGDTQAGLKGFRSEAAELVFSRQSVFGFAFDIESLVIARLHGLRIAQVGVDVRVDHSESSVRVVRDSVAMIRDMVRIRRAAQRGDYGGDFRSGRSGR